MSISDAQDKMVVDAVIVGAGLGGLYAAHSLTQAGFTVRGFEAGESIGGTWYWNRYPGARCDIDSIYYSYSFSREIEQEWTWTERYATQPEILRYVEFVADRLGLRRHFKFGARVIEATWDDGSATWTVTLQDGQRQRCRYLVAAVGPLSTPKELDIEGLSQFSGITASTGTWDVDLEALRGLRIGIIGTGSSGVQCIPLLADVAESLVVFQRTPNYVLPARNAPLDAALAQEVKSTYPQVRAAARSSTLGIPEEAPILNAFDVDAEERRLRYEAAYEVSGLTSVGSVFRDLLTSQDANETVADFLRSKVAEVVRDPLTRERLTPRYHPYGAKRTCFGTEYYETYNRDHVKLVSLRETPLVRMTRNGVLTTAEEYTLDAVVLATGFDAVTGSLFRLNVTGRDGLKLTDAWSSGPATFLGLMSRGFPNLFMIAGPQSPSIVSNFIVSIEQHTDWLTDLLTYMREESIDRVEPAAKAVEWWGRAVDEALHGTLYETTDSWYRGSNIEGKANAFLAYVGGVNTYRDICEHVASTGYRGLEFGRYQDDHRTDTSTSPQLDQALTGPGKER